MFTYIIMKFTKKQLGIIFIQLLMIVTAFSLWIISQQRADLPASYIPTGTNEEILLLTNFPSEIRAGENTEVNTNRDILPANTPVDLSLLSNFEGKVKVSKDGKNAIVIGFFEKGTDTETPGATVSLVNMFEQTLTNTECSTATWIDNERYLCGKKRDGNLDLFISLDEETYIATLYGVPDVSIHISPDHSRVAFIPLFRNNNANVYVLDMVSHGVEKVSFNGFVYDGMWSLDGSAFFYQRNTSYIPENAELWRFRVDNRSNEMLGLFDMRYFVFENNSLGYVIVPEDSSPLGGFTDLLNIDLTELLGEELARQNEQFSYLKNTYYNLYSWEIEDNIVTFIATVSENKDYEFFDFVYTMDGVKRLILFQQTGVSDDHSPNAAEFEFIDVIGIFTP